MKIIYFLLVTFFLLFLYSCTQHREYSGVIESNAPKVTEAKGYVVPQDSMSPPKVFPVINVKRIPVGKTN